MVSWLSLFSLIYRYCSYFDCAQWWLYYRWLAKYHHAPVQQFADLSPHQKFSVSNKLQVNFLTGISHLWTAQTRRSLQAWSFSGSDEIFLLTQTLPESNRSKQPIPGQASYHWIDPCCTNSPLKPSAEALTSSERSHLNWWSSKSTFVCQAEMCSGQPSVELSDDLCACAHSEAARSETVHANWFLVEPF